MTTRNTLLLVPLVLLSLAFTVAADVTGTWEATVSTQRGDMTYTFVFKVEGDSLTGTVKSQFAENEISEGKIDGDQISFVVNATFQDRSFRMEYSGKVTGDEIAFTRKVGDFPAREFVAKRVG